MTQQKMNIDGEKNLGCEPLQIAVKLTQLLGNAPWWVEHKTFCA
jgi:hypothetical protein